MSMTYDADSIIELTECLAHALAESDTLINGDGTTDYFFVRKKEYGAKIRQLIIRELKQQFGESD